MDYDSKFQRQISQLAEGVTWRLELTQEVWKYLLVHRDERHELLNWLASHPDENLRATAHDVENLLRAEALSEQTKDLAQLRRTSPLQPGVELTVNFGRSPDEAVRATFLQFIQRRRDRVPVAFVAFKERIRIGDAEGAFGLLKLLYFASWTESEIVVVHLVDALPDDIDAFYAKDPFPYEQAVEIHANYSVFA